MTDWYLSFLHDESLSTDACARAVESVAAAPAEIVVGEPDGNPRDFYARSVSITGRRDDLVVVMSASQSMYSPSDENGKITSVSITLRSAAYAAKLRAWRALQAAFAALGCRERTLENSAAEILDDAVAANDDDTARSLRAHILAALIEQAKITRSVGIRSPRVDVEPILAAYRDPEGMVSFGLADCGLRALPAGFARFPNLEVLSLEEDAFDGDVLRGVSLPKLRDLRLGGRSLRRLTKDDLAGFPALEVLNLADTPLQELDAAILDVCPKLVRVYVDDTPLSRDAARWGALRKAWVGMKWHYHDLSTRFPPVDRTDESPRSQLFTDAQYRAMAAQAAAAPAPAQVEAPAPPAPPAVATSAPSDVPAKRPSFEGGVLDLDAIKHDIAAIRAAVTSGDYGDATIVRLQHTIQGDAFAALVATSRAFPRLVELDLGGASVSDVGARALATEAVGLDALETIHLGDAPGSRNAHFGGVNAGAAEELARSTRLPALRRVTRSFTHHVMAEGATERDETIAVVRADGRIVELVMFNLCWP